METVLLRTSEVCSRVGISTRQLEYWVLIGVVEPVTERHGAKIHRKFSEDDLWVLRKVKKLTDEGFLVSRAAEKVKRTIKG